MDTSFWHKLDFIDRNDFMVSITDIERSRNVTFKVKTTELLGPILETILCPTDGQTKHCSFMASISFFLMNIGFEACFSSQSNEVKIQVTKYITNHNEYVTLTETSK